MNAPLQPGQTPLDPDEAAELIPAHIATQAALNEWEQRNIAEAVEWLAQRRIDVLDEAICRDVHRRMFSRTWRWAGRFRRSDKNIGQHWPEISIHLRQLFDYTRYWIEHETYGVDEIATRFHHRLVSIHPFPNGNGRHARLMTDALLRYHDVPAFTWGLGPILRDDAPRQRYLAALRLGDAGDLTALMAFVRSH